jgi:hypothetical protein
MSISPAHTELSSTLQAAKIHKPRSDGVDACKDKLVCVRARSSNHSG